MGNRGDRMTDTRPFTFDDLAGGNGVTMGRALYRAAHGDRDTRDVLQSVRGAYAELAATTADQPEQAT